MAPVRIALLAITWMALLTLLHVYAWRRLVRDPGLTGRARRAGTIAIAVLGVCVPVAILVGRFLHGGAGRVLAWPAYLWYGVLLYSLLVLLAVDGVRVARWAARKVRRGAPAPVDLSRREMFARVAAGAAVLTSGSAAAFGVPEAMAKVALNTVEVPLARLPRAMDGFSILQLTDIHAGGVIGREFIAELVATANAAAPDLIAITGDLADGSPDTLADVVAPLAELRAPHGVYFVTGNHEYYAGVDAWLDHLRDVLGVRVLRNERVAIDVGRVGFDLAGVDDREGSRHSDDHGPDLGVALAGRDPRRELVLLAHQPVQIYDALGLGVGLQLSGHTHGGQVWPWHYAVKLQQRGHLQGLERIEDTWLYTSRGCGFWGPPMRVGAPPEVARLVLRSAPPTG